MSPLPVQLFTLANSQPEPQGESSFSIKPERWQPLLRLLSHPGAFASAAVPPECAASSVVLPGWHSHVPTGIGDAKEPQAWDPQQPLHEHSER